MTSQILSSAYIILRITPYSVESTILLVCVRERETELCEQSLMIEPAAISSWAVTLETTSEALRLFAFASSANTVSVQRVEREQTRGGSGPGACHIRV